MFCRRIVVVLVLVLISVGVFLVVVIPSRSQSTTCSWTGTWSITRYSGNNFNQKDLLKMRFQQRGNTVDGTYEGTIEGKQVSGQMRGQVSTYVLDGNNYEEVRGTWTQSDKTTGTFWIRVVPPPSGSCDYAMGGTNCKERWDNCETRWSASRETTGATRTSPTTIATATTATTSSRSLSQSITSSTSSVLPETYTTHTPQVSAVLGAAVAIFVLTFLGKNGSPLKEVHSPAEEGESADEQRKEKESDEQRPGFAVPFMPFPTMPEWAKADVVKGWLFGPDSDIYRTPVPEGTHQRIADLLQTPPDLLKNLTRTEWWHLSDQQQKDKVEEITRAITTELGVGPVTIIYDPNLKYGGQMDSRKVPPEMTLNWGPSGFKDPAALIDAIAHELNHNLQNQPGVLKSNLSKHPSWTDPKPTRKYLDAMAKIFSGSFNYPLPETDPIRYTEALSERDSRDFGKKVAEKISKNAYKQKLRDMIMDQLTNPAPRDPVPPRVLTKGQVQEIIFEGTALEDHALAKLRQDQIKQLWLQGKIRIEGLNRPMSPGL